MPLLGWQKKAKENGEGEQIEVSLPKETQEKLDKAIGVSEEVGKLTEKMGKVDSIASFIEEMKQEREEAKRKEASSRQREAQEESDSELSELILTDPKKAIERAVTPQSQAIIRLHASNVKREVFENMESFPYYTGDVKTEVDKLLAGQSLQAQADPSVVENCYFTVLGRKQKELAEGKLKSRFASSVGNNGTNGGNIGDGKGEGKVKLDITDDIRKAAKFAGVTPEKYAEMLVEDGVPYA